MFSRLDDLQRDLTAICERPIYIVTASDTPPDLLVKLDRTALGLYGPLLSIMLRNLTANHPRWHGPGAVLWLNDEGLRPYGESGVVAVAAHEAAHAVDGWTCSDVARHQFSLKHGDNELLHSASFFRLMAHIGHRIERRGWDLDWNVAFGSHGGCLSSALATEAVELADLPLLEIASTAFCGAA